MTGKRPLPPKEFHTVMGMSRTLLERQLATAVRRRDQQAAQLSGRGLSEDQYRSDPTWRRWNSQCRRLNVRLRGAARKESLAAGTSAAAHDE